MSSRNNTLHLVEGAVGPQKARGAANQTPLAGIGEREYRRSCEVDQFDPHLPPVRLIAEELGLPSAFVEPDALPAEYADSTLAR